MSLSKKTLEQQQELPPRTYTFPVQVDYSVMFAAKGAHIDSATLHVNEIPLSVLTLGQADTDLESPPPDTTSLPFFGAEPFHGALSANMTVRVTLVSRDTRIPSLILEQVSPSLSWTEVSSPHMIEVTTHTASGPVDKTLVYMTNRIGFKRGGQ
jgi:hypothetical protein